MTNYPRELREFLAWCAPRLEEILDAVGAREVWLQGEAHRYFRHHRARGPLAVCTNAHNKNDLAFYECETADEPAAVVEIKLYGLDYLQKNLTGYHTLAPYLKPAGNRRFRFQPGHAAKCHPREGSILKDYQKLLAQTGRRYLLLVVNTQRPANAFGQAIQRVDFGGPGLNVLKTSKCSATLWKVA